MTDLSSHTGVKPLWVQALAASADSSIREAKAAQSLSDGLELDALLNALPVAVLMEDWSEYR